MARIRMLQTAAGPDGAYVGGLTYDVPGPLGSRYVSAGAAEWVERPVERAVTEPPEARSDGNDDSRELAALTKDELVALAEKRGVEVERADGKDAVPLKSDYLRVLSG